MKTTAFKSERAAKMAFTKAERAWNALPSGSSVYRDGMQDPTCDDPSEASRKAEEKKDAAFEVMRAIYNQANAQGFYLDSFGARWHFGHNPTRDLIAANMD
jgi:hypothetical protein